jgi:anaerobic ribonucleoside-triphosphate reductase
MPKTEIDQYADIIPYVLVKGMKKQKFDPDKIYSSLINETNISKSVAVRVVEETAQFLISSKLKLVSPPLIREVVNTFLLRYKLESVRLEYQRIGIPFFDLSDIFDEYDNIDEVKEKIFEMVKQEFESVKKLIKKLRDNGKINDT